MKKLAILLVVLPVFAAAPEGFKMWSSAELKSKAAAVKLDDHKAGVDRMADWGNHKLWVIRRDGDGEAEIHDTQVDVITVIAGEGILIVGGKMLSPHTTAPGEVRGPSIEGGEKVKMATGDVFHIPAKIPHQMLVPKSLTFEVVKVETK
jgi:quercetin dioxygenase-like cupin family protein